MNLLFRLIYRIIAAHFHSRLPIRYPRNTLTLRVLPNDLDINMHMNNGRYLSMCDLSRVDMFVRTGLLKTLFKNNWMPVISEQTIKYKKSLGPFEKYELQMAIVGWDEKAFHMTYTFTIKDRVIAECVSYGVIVSKEGVIPPEHVIKAVNAQHARPHRRPSN